MYSFGRGLHNKKLEDEKKISSAQLAEETESFSVSCWYYVNSHIILGIRRDSRVSSMLLVNRIGPENAFLHCESDCFVPILFWIHIGKLSNTANNSIITSNSLTGDCEWSFSCIAIVLRDNRKWILHGKEKKNIIFHVNFIQDEHRIIK